MSKLQPLENTVVHLRTQAEYEEYMQLAEEAGWRWANGSRPTRFYNWYACKESSVVEVKDKFLVSLIECNDASTTLTLPELKAKFGIGTPSCQTGQAQLPEKPKPSTWEPHFTKDGHTLSRDQIKLADGTTYTQAQLRDRLNLLRSIEKAYRQKFPSSK